MAEETKTERLARRNRERQQAWRDRRKTVKALAKLEEIAESATE